MDKEEQGIETLQNQAAELADVSSGDALAVAHDNASDNTPSDFHNEAGGELFDFSANIEQAQMTASDTGYVDHDLEIEVGYPAGGLSFEHNTTHASETGELIEETFGGSVTEAGVVDATLGASVTFDNDPTTTDFSVSASLHQEIGEEDESGIRGANDRVGAAFEVGGSVDVHLDGDPTTSAFTATSSASMDVDPPFDIPIEIHAELTATTTEFGETTLSMDADGSVFGQEFSTESEPVNNANEDFGAPPDGFNPYTADFSGLDEQYVEEAQELLVNGTAYSDEEAQSMVLAAHQGDVSEILDADNQTTLPVDSMPQAETPPAELPQQEVEVQTDAYVSGYSFPSGGEEASFNTSSADTSATDNVEAGAPQMLSDSAFQAEPEQSETEVPQDIISDDGNGSLSEYPGIVEGASGYADISNGSLLEPNSGEDEFTGITASSSGYGVDITAGASGENLETAPLGIDATALSDFSGITDGSEGYVPNGNLSDPSDFGMFGVGTDALDVNDAHSYGAFNGGEAISDSNESGDTGEGGE